MKAKRAAHIPHASVSAVWDVYDLKHLDSIYPVVEFYYGICAGVKLRRSLGYIEADTADCYKAHR